MDDPRKVRTSAFARIPILDLEQQYKQIAPELEQSVLSVLRSGQYILGKHGKNLESQVADESGCAHGIGVANGTDALILALWSLDIGPGDEVITPAFTFAATAEAIALRGARPIFIDVDPATFNLDPTQLERLITPKTRAVLPVHLYGQPADMDAIGEIARKHHLHVIEDNAQAIGAYYRGQPTGSLGDVACISFYPTKNLGAAGDAGMLVTKSSVIADRLRMLRAHGCRQRYYHEELGVNSRLDEIQAVVLLAKMPHLSAWNEKRRQVASFYQEFLSSSSNLVLPAHSADIVPVWHQYTVRIVGDGTGPNLRDAVKQQLSDRGIDSMCYYPVPLHLQSAFAHLGYRQGDFPVAEAIAHQVLSLPMYPELTRQQVELIARTLKEILSKSSSVFVPTGLPAQSISAPVIPG